MSSLGFPPGMVNWVRPGLTLGPGRQTWLFAAHRGFSCIICYRATAWEPCALQVKLGWVLSICIYLVCFIICCLSPCKLCCKGKTKLCISENDRCCGQRCVQFSSLVSSGLRPRAPALYIIEFSLFCLWMDWILFLFSRWVENCHFAWMAWFSVSTQAVAQWQVRYGWGGFWGHRATLLHKSSTEMFRLRDWNMRWWEGENECKDASTQQATLC